MIELYIDPSYTGTGCCLIKNKQITLNLFSQGDTKRTLSKYMTAGFKLQDDLGEWIMKEVSKDDYLSIYMEAPFAGMHASGGLYGLQFLYLFLFKFLNSMGYKISVYSIAPSFISSHVKRNNGKKDSITIRKSTMLKHVDRLEKDGYVITNPGMEKHSGDDVATAFLFWVYTKQDCKKWELLYDYKTRWNGIE